MEEHIYYRIISNTGPCQRSTAQLSSEFQGSIPLKHLHSKQEKSSLAYLSSLMQTENLLINKLTYPPATQTTRDRATFVTQKASSLPQTRKKGINEKSAENSTHTMGILAETRKRLLKKESALLNIVGQYNPGEHRKKDNKGMQETIYKARTYTMMPTHSNFLPSYKKRQNHLKLKEDFTNFIKTHDWKAQFQEKKKTATQPSSTEIIHAKFDKPAQNKASNTQNLYRFLKTENTRTKRLKTHQSNQYYPELSKRMTQILLKSELKVLPEQFDLAKVGKRKNFQLKTDI